MSSKGVTIASAVAAALALNACTPYHSSYYHGHPYYGTQPTKKVVVVKKRHPRASCRGMKAKARCGGSGKGRNGCKGKGKCGSSKK